MGRRLYASVFFIYIIAGNETSTIGSTPEKVQARPSKTDEVDVGFTHVFTSKKGFNMVGKNSDQSWPL